MTYSLTVKLNGYIENRLQEYSDKEMIILEALTMYFLIRDHFFREHKDINYDGSKIEFQLEDDRTKLEYVNETDENENSLNIRPEKYMEYVKFLKSISNVTKEDLYYSAECLNTDVEQLKEWLYQDGYYFEIMS